VAPNEAATVLATQVRTIAKARVGQIRNTRLMMNSRRVSTIATWLITKPLTKKKITTPRWPGAMRSSVITSSRRSCSQNG